MKIQILFFFLLSSLLVSCSSKKHETPSTGLFAEELPIEACYILYNLKTQKFVHISDVVNCHERYPAASTFKIPLAVMAFDSKVLKDENTSLNWDGEKRTFEVWNKNHTATSWMRDSVVWFSQRLTPKIGLNKIEDYLKMFRYGNQDMSSGLKYSWLTPAPFIGQPMSNSLRISGVEQIFFLKELWLTNLPTSRKSQLLTKQILGSEKTTNGNVLTGKTGSGFIGEHHELRLGWFVGHLQTKDHSYLVVSNFIDKQKVPGEKTYGGKQAKEMLIKQLTKANLW